MTLGKWFTHALASALVIGSVSIAGAANVAINFGAEEPNGAGSTVDGPAGVLGTAVWNNTTGATGSATNLLDGDGGATAVSVDWSSPNTWASQGRGEENNTAPAGDDRDLMTGYLDTGGLGGQGVNVTVNGLGALYDVYDVYVYIKGGVNGRGGEYTIGGVTQTHTTTVAFDGTYELGSEGDYLLFEDVSGDSFTLTTAATIGGTQRAGVNAIEIAPVPEPATWMLLLVGVGGAAIWSRRR